MTGQGRRRRRWVWALLGAAALVGLFLLVRSPGGAPEAEAPAAPPEPPPVAAAPPPEPVPVDEALPEAALRFLAANRYPPGSGRLTPEHTDLLRPNQRYERPRPIPDTLGDDPQSAIAYHLSADRYDVTGAERVLAWLEAERAGRPAALRVIEAALRREGRAGFEGDPIPVGFRLAGERWESALPMDALGDHHGPFLLEVRFEYAPGQEHTDTLRFFRTPEERIPARFTGSFHDYERDGDLVLEVGVDVEQAGFYRFDANLYDRDGAPAAFTSWKGELDAGSALVPLEVHGKLLRDTGARAPYTLGELRGYRFLDGAYPDRESLPPDAPRHTTDRYDLEAFRDEPWESEHTRRMVELLLEDAAAGIGLDLPDLAGSPPR